MVKRKEQGEQGCVMVIMIPKTPLYRKEMHVVPAKCRTDVDIESDEDKVM